MKIASSPLSSHCSDRTRHWAYFPVSLQCRLHGVGVGGTPGGSSPDLQSRDPVCAQLPLVFSEDTWSGRKPWCTLTTDSQGPHGPAWTCLAPRGCVSGEQGTS